MNGVPNGASGPGGTEEKILVSACLLGKKCTYKAGHNRDGVLLEELERAGAQIVPFCPEEHGGLSTPRPAADLTAPAADVVAGRGRVVTVAGNEDVTEAFLAGAKGALELCQRLGIRRAYLKERSPSCGCSATHMDGQVVEGPGVTAQTLGAAGIRCVGVEGRREA